MEFKYYRIKKGLKGVKWLRVQLPFIPSVNGESIARYSYMDKALGGVNVSGTIIKLSLLEAYYNEINEEQFYRKQ